MQFNYNEAVKTHILLLILQGLQVWKEMVTIIIFFLSDI